MVPRDAVTRRMRFGGPYVLIAAESFRFSRQTRVCRRSNTHVSAPGRRAPSETRGDDLLDATASHKRGDVSSPPRDVLSPGRVREVQTALARTQPILLEGGLALAGTQTARSWTLMVFIVCR